MEKAVQLAYDRTWLAYERTMQAWIRTAISLVTFGFSIYKLADIVEKNPERLLGPHEFGYMLVAIGFLALAIATIEYRQSIQILRREYGRSPRSRAVFFAGVIAALGLFALLSMMFGF